MKNNYRVRLKAHVATRLNSNKPLSVKLENGQNLQIKSDRDAQQPLSEADWLVFEAGGFETENEGKIFGEALRQALHMTGLCCRVGLDARFNESNQQLSYDNSEFISEVYGKSYLPLPDIHGVIVYQDDGRRIPPVQVSANLAGGRSSTVFTEILEEVLLKSGGTVANLSSIQRAIRVLNLADMSSDPITKLVLSISTVEGMAREPQWTLKQKRLIAQASQIVENCHKDIEGVEMVSKAINGLLSRVSVRQRVKHLLKRYGLYCLNSKWEALYTKRSQLFHGHSIDIDSNSYVEDSELIGLGEEAFRLCAQIILTIAHQSGLFVPHCAATNFDVKISG